MHFCPSPKRVAALALAGAAASLFGLSTGAPPAQASLGVACPDPTTAAFAPWGDPAAYAYAPNGGFESGTTGWTLRGGAAVVAGSEPFAAHAAGGRLALALPPGSSATSPPMCVGLLSGKMRFFSANAGAPDSRLRVQVVYNGGVGGLLGTLGSTLGLTDVAALSSGSAWQPSSAVPMLGGALPLLTRSVQFRFTPADGDGAWRIDDVFLDPLMHR